MKSARRVSAVTFNGLACAGVLAACAVSGAAHAGNLEQVPVDPVVVVAAPTWQGFYVGGTAGYAFGADDRVGHKNPAGVLVTRRAGDLDGEGFNYGVQLGWRGERALSRGSFVYGIELGYNGGDVDDSFVNGGYTGSVDLNHVLGLRAKTGLTNQSGNTMVYGILGYVHGDFDYAVNGTAGGDTINLNTAYDTDGYSIGLGVEHLLSDSWSVKAEWEYYNFGSKTLFDAGGSSTVATPTYSNVQLGLNFRF